MKTSFGAINLLGIWSIWFLTPVKVKAAKLVPWNALEPPVTPPHYSSPSHPEAGRRSQHGAGTKIFQAPPLKIEISPTGNLHSRTMVNTIGSICVSYSRHEVHIARDGEVRNHGHVSMRELTEEEKDLVSGGTLYSDIENDERYLDDALPDHKPEKFIDKLHTDLSGGRAHR